MPLTATFAANPKNFCGSHSILVVEPPTETANFRNGLNQNQNNVLAAPMLLDFTVTDANIRGCKMLSIFYNNAPGTAQPCYFLPYLPDGATTMTLAAGAGLFFTSTLSGCTVQVTGPTNAPTVTHANARSDFLAHGAVQAQNTINGMLPPAGAGAGLVTRADYHAKVTWINTWVGKAKFKHDAWEHGSKLSRNVSPSGGYEVGCFVFGVQNGGNWKFYYQTTVGVHGSIKLGYLWKTQKQNIPNAEIVLGKPIKFFG